MIGLVLITGLVAIAVVAVLGSALARQLIDTVPPETSVPGTGPDRTLRADPPTRPDADGFASDAGADGDDAVPLPARTGGALAPRPADEDRPKTDVEPLRHRSTLSFKAQLAFVHSPEPDTVVLDCTLAEFDDDPDGVVPPGTPFTLQLRLPETAWFATSLELLLEQWATESRVVEIALLARDGHAKAHVGDGSSRLMLEVDSAAGLSVG